MEGKRHPAPADSNSAALTGAEGGDLQSVQSFREVVHEAMIDQGLNPHQLSQASGVNKNSVYGFLDGSRSIESEALERICAVLGLVLRPSDA